MKADRYFALVEQALISGGNFLLYLYAARSLSKEAWGELSLALGLVLVIQGFQRAFVTIPMVTSGGQASFAASLAFWKRIQLLVSVVLFVLLALAYAASLMFFEQWLQRALAYACCLVIPVFYLEFARRLTVMSAAMRRLVRMAIAYVVTMAFVLLAAFLLQLTGSVWVFVGAMCIAPLASIAAGGIHRSSGTLALTEGAWSSKTLWDFGKWAAASSLAYTGYNFAIQGILAAISGPVAVGIFAAARNLTQPVSTLIQAIDTVDKPRAGRAFAEKGIGGLWSVIRKSWAWMLILAVPYLAAIFLFAEEILIFLYGAKYQDATQAVQLWCLVALAMIFAQPLETGLYVVRRPDWLFYGRVLTAIAVLAFTPWLIQGWSFAGALVALFCGWFLAGICAAFQLRKYRPNEAMK